MTRYALKTHTSPSDRVRLLAFRTLAALGVDDENLDVEDSELSETLVELAEKHHTDYLWLLRPDQCALLREKTLGVSLILTELSKKADLRKEWPADWEVQMAQKIEELVNA